MSNQRILLSLLTFSVAILSTEYCHAQLFRGKFRNHRTIQFRAMTSTPSMNYSMEKSSRYNVYSNPSTGASSQTSTPPATVFPVESYYADQFSPGVSRLLDGTMTHRYRNPYEVDSRYIGGFHESHFYNLGIPNGDIGLRGNGLNFRPW